MTPSELSSDVLAPVVHIAVRVHKFDPLRGCGRYYDTLPEIRLYPPGLSPQVTDPVSGTHGTPGIDSRLKNPFPLHDSVNGFSFGLNFSGLKVVGEGVSFLLGNKVFV